MRRHSLRASALLLGASVALGACGSDDDGDAPDDSVGGTEAPGSVADDASGEGDPPVTDPGTDPAVDGAQGEGNPGQGGEGGDDTEGPGEGGDPTEPGTEVPPAGGEPGSGDPDTVSRVGVVGFSQTVEGGVGRANAGAVFFELEEALAVDAIEAVLSPPADECTVGRLETGPAPGGVAVPDLGDIDVERETIGAGENVVVSGPAGSTYATLTRLLAFELVVYVPEGDRTDATVTFPVPSGLVVDVLGGDFPRFEGVAVPDVVPLTGVEPTGIADENDRFVWDAAGGEARVEIELELFGARPALSVTCSAIDDGEFELPQSVRDEIPDGQSGVLSVTRTATRVERGDGAALIVRSEASES